MSSARLLTLLSMVSDNEAAANRANGMMGKHWLPRTALVAHDGYARGYDPYHGISRRQCKLWCTRHVNCTAALWNCESMCYLAVGHVSIAKNSQHCKAVWMNNRSAVARRFDDPVKLRAERHSEVQRWLTRRSDIGHLFDREAEGVMNKARNKAREAARDVIRSAKLSEAEAAIVQARVMETLAPGDQNEALYAATLESKAWDKLTQLDETHAVHQPPQEQPQQQKQQKQPQTQRKPPQKQPQKPPQKPARREPKLFDVEGPRFPYTWDGRNRTVSYPPRCGPPVAIEDATWVADDIEAPSAADGALACMDRCRLLAARSGCNAWRYAAREHSLERRYHTFLHYFHEVLLPLPFQVLLPLPVGAHAPPLASRATRTRARATCRGSAT